jgi:hypothetical protein
MADETIKTKRSPVKPDVVNAALLDSSRPAGATRPSREFVEQTLGAPLDDEQRGCYDAGYWDDDAKRGPLTADDIRLYEKARHEARRQMEAVLRLRRIKAEQARAAEAARQVADPTAITCTGCGEQFEFLRTQTFKMCGQCQWADVEERQAQWEAEQRAEKDAEKARAASSRENWTQAQWDDLRREARAYMEGPALRRAHRWLYLLDHVKLARELWWRLCTNPAAKKRCEKLSAYATMWDKRAREWHEAYDEAGERYWKILEDDERRRNIHPKFRYCHNDGLPIPWERDAQFCDDLCQKAHEARGEEHVDIGTRCVCGAVLITDDQPLIEALPVNASGDVFHTWECLMSDPTIDVDDYKDFGPDAACWKPLLHVALVKPAHSFKERQKQILRSPEKVLAMSGGPTAKMILENPEQARALLAQWMPSARALPAASPRLGLPAAPRTMLPEFAGSQEQNDERRMLAWAARFDGNYFTLTAAREGTGKGWIATARVRPTIDRLMKAGALVAHPGLQNRWKLAEQNENG